MHRKYFPPCPVEGPIEPPMPFSHLGSQGAVPAKCASCEHLFEGECNRAHGLVDGFLHLDYGPCGIEGPTDPVRIENRHLQSVVEVPRKCTSCVHLTYDLVRGFTCFKDKKKWGDCDRGLDWGDWQPKRIQVRLKRPAYTSDAMLECVHAADLVGFVKAFREANPGLSMQEAKADYLQLRKLSQQVEEERRAQREDGHEDEQA